MNIETKFNINDDVYPIRKGGYNAMVVCGTCLGLTTVGINNTTRRIMCPDCGGRGGDLQWNPGKWFVDDDHISKIGKISVELYRQKDFEKNRYNYMIDGTGIGSGTLWSESELFLTKEEAQKECDIRNTEKKNGGQPTFKISNNEKF